MRLVHRLMAGALGPLNTLCLHASSAEAIMSKENEALVRRAVEAYRRGDAAGLLELVHPDLEWTYLNPEDPDPQPQVRHGRDQLAWGWITRPGKAWQPT